MSNVTSFPAPVGGVAVSQDLAPSVVFAVLYGSLVPLLVYKVLNKHFRVTLLAQAAIFVIERVVIFSLRAVQSQNQSKRESKPLATYLQITFAMGFIGITQNLVNVLRCLLVSSTKGSGSTTPTTQKPSSEIQVSTDLLEGGAGTTPDSEFPDLPSERRMYRSFTGLLSLFFVGAIIPGVIGNAEYSGGMVDQAKADRVFCLRYLSTALALIFTLVLAFAALWARFWIPRVRKKAASLLVFLSFLMIIPPIYRLCVMYNRTTSLTSTAPGSQNATVSKATFYAFHMLPEWMVSATLVGVNIRQLFDTGPFGDYRWRDETPQEIEKRLKEEAKRAAKRERLEGEAVRTRRI